ncbi:MAG: GNAT family N-acetyltransferase [Flavitalea sp.]
MGLKQIDHGTKDYQEMVRLRHQILRQPLGLDFSPEELEKEKEEILMASFEDDEMLGCCMLTKSDEPGTLRLRQMAVPKNLQGKGIGAALLIFAENIARDKGYKKIKMHARDTAVGFYERSGYQLRGDSFLELGIPHHIMEKSL